MVMEFKRKRVRGRTQATYREWYDETAQYRITWRSEWQGIQVIPAFYACVRTVRPGGEYWDFVGRMGPYKTFKKATDEAERHRKTWERYLQLANGERKGRMDRIRALDYKARTVNRRLLGSVPVWVNETDPYALRFLTRTSQTIDESSSENESISELDPTPGPVLNVEETAWFTTDESELEKSDLPSPARTVKARGKAPKKRAKKPTKELLIAGVD